MSRMEFYTCSFGELENRIKGFMLREGEIKNIGSRRVYSAIINGLLSFGKGKFKTEQQLWPMSFDEDKKKVETSESLVKKHFSKLKAIWPDINGKD